MLDGGIGIPTGTDGKLWFGGDAMFGINNHEGDVGDKTTLYGAHVNVGYQFVPTPCRHTCTALPDSSSTVLAWRIRFRQQLRHRVRMGGAAGVSAPMGSASLWVEARFVSRGDTKFIPIMVGVSIGGS